MVRQKSAKDIANLLRCASILEEKTFLMYKNLAEKVELPMVKSLLLNIAYDSQRHSAVFKGMSESFAEPDEKLKDCAKRMGGVWETVDSLGKQIAGMKRISSQDLDSLEERLARFESALGEEYYIFVQAKTLQFMSKEIGDAYNVKLTDLKDIFENIIRDEEHHRELLGTLRGIIVGNKEEEFDNTPKVIYQHPDSWIRSLEHQG